MAGFAAVALAFGERLAAGFAAGLAFATAPFFFGDCFAVALAAVVFGVADLAAALVVAVRFFGERVAVALGADVFVAVCLVAIQLAPDVGRLFP
ncbi:MAG: hypothetical protein H6822_28095 [Planctomycetaceae bacterium]|nr:hypothetical protein [Planctomycetales bacterium]MCB9926043.1 hypothetical protein [Planctomycetaceae bacterium]